MIATGGGAFDRADTPIYFAAGSATHAPTHYLVAVNDLYSGQGEEELQRYLDSGRRILLDSGIFNLTNQHKRKTGVTMDQALALAPEEIDGFDRLYERYCYLAQTYGDRLWGYIELDQGGAENKRRTRARLEAEGLRPMPVYHPLNDGWSYFDELAAGYDRLCLGNIVQARAATRIRLLHTMWERKRAYPDLWIHVLGLSASEWMTAVPFDSCDSSSWTAGLRWNHVRGDTSALRRVGTLGPEFRYITQGRESYDDACRTYADTMAQTNTLWRDLLDRADELGMPPCPERYELEGDATPA